MGEEVTMEAFVNSNPLSLPLLVVPLPPADSSDSSKKSSIVIAPPHTHLHLATFPLFLLALSPSPLSHTNAPISVDFNLTFITLSQVEA